MARPTAFAIQQGVTMSRRFLVVVRAGDSSLHPQWLQGSAGQQVERNWDLIVNYYGDDPQRYRDHGPDVVRIDGKGPKWPALKKLLADQRATWNAYDYVWLPDDDLAADCGTINRMFEMMAGLGLQLGQPSLSWTSYVSLVMTLHNPAFALRYSSFVEPMAPCFSRALLERVIVTFDQIISGWGLDYVWPTFLRNPATECAVLDRVQVTHTRPVGGPNYRFNREAGIDPKAEMAYLLKKHGIAEALQISYGGLDRDGNTYNLFGPRGTDFVYRLCDGYLPRLAPVPQHIGTIFNWHAKARADYLTAAPAPPAAVPATAQTASDPLAQFRAAAAGRVLEAQS
jgi:hypothetical protein